MEGNQTCKSQESEELKAILESQTKFAKDLYLVLSKNTKENLLFSPFSLAASLTMIYIVSSNGTENQLKSVLHLPLEKDVIQKVYKELISGYKKEVTDYELRTSNMTCISHKMAVTDPFASCLSKDFSSTINHTDFGQLEEVKRTVNKMVEKETSSKIKEVSAGHISDSTRMMIVTAVYFKGLWAHPFNLSHTKMLPFWITPETSVDVPMMAVEKRFRFLHKPKLEATLIALDYKADLSFVILLPDERDGLFSLEQKIAHLDLNALDRTALNIETLVLLPKFRLEENMELAPCLSMMGMKDLFSENSCNLSGICGSKDLFVSSVIHKAVLEVDEEGTEIPTATGDVLGMLSYPHTFTADHPFIFYVKENLHDGILFVGRYVSP